MISCLTITQPGRLPELARAIACFRNQTLTGREMVIVHDGNQDFHRDLQQLIDRDSDNNQFQLHQVSPGSTLGELRNFAVAFARYTLVCQWDDDDLYHPRRLEMQFAYLKIQGTDFCFLTDQLHLFEDEGRLYWDDWSIESPPMNLIQGTLMGDKYLLGKYPALKRGEDTPVVMELVRRGRKIAGLGGMGWLYIYNYTGKNVWDRAHHAAISAWKHIGVKRLQGQFALLDKRLREYPVASMAVDMPCNNQVFRMQIGCQ